MVDGIRDIPAGKTPRKSTVYPPHWFHGGKQLDFSHLLPAAVRKTHVLMVRVDDYSSYVDLRVFLWDRRKREIWGGGRARVRGDSLIVEESWLNSTLQGRGIGKAMYEALYRAAHDEGAKSVRGGRHSSMARRVHASLAAKHGWAYQANPNTFDFDGDWDPYDWEKPPEAGGRNDERWQSYQYQLSGLPSEVKWAPGQWYGYVETPGLKHPTKVEVQLAFHEVDIPQRGKHLAVYAFLAGKPGLWKSFWVKPREDMADYHLKKGKRTLRLDRQTVLNAAALAQPQHGLGTWDSARAESKLLVTDEHLRQARGNKAIAIVWMKPQDFLSLTTISTDSDWARSISERPVKSITAYNRYAQEGETIIMPMLFIDRATGRVEGHEGRHRAAAVMNAGGWRFPVAVVLREEGYATYYEEGGPPHYRKTFLSSRDIPRTLHPEGWGKVWGSVARTAPVVLDDATFTDALELWTEWAE